MGRPQIWGPDELQQDTARGVQDGDLKITWVDGCVCIAVRVAGAWSPDYLLRSARLGQPNGPASLGANGKVPQSELPASLQGGIILGSTAGTACEGNDARLNDRAPLAHLHAIADVTALQATLDGKAAAAHWHAIGDVTGLQAAIDGKAAAIHTHAQASVTGLVADLATKQAASEKGEANGYAALGADGKVPTAQLPASGWTTLKKAADTARVNATLSADPDLAFAVLTNTKYAVRGRLFFDTGATADFKWRHTGPASPAVVRLARKWIVPGGVAFTGIAVDVAFSGADLSLIGTGTNGGYIEIDGILHIGATSGTFAIQWAQNTTTANQNTILRAGSYLEYQVVM